MNSITIILNIFTFAVNKKKYGAIPENKNE